MQLDTRHFGVIEIDGRDVVRFPDGLPGFENVREFVILDSSGGESPFKWLQSVDEPELAFAIVNPFSIKKDYNIEVKQEAVEDLGIESQADVAVYAIVVVPGDISRVSMNLKAPIIINTKNNKGSQVILDTDKYGVRHYIVDELRGQEV